MNSLSADVSCWKVAEIDLTSHRVYENPYKDVAITAAFVGPQGQRIIREAFWCGQNVWKVLFAPTAADWLLRVEKQTEDGNARK